MEETFTRTINLINNENFFKLQQSNVLLFGVGGVGSYVAEGLIRAGIGNITIVDNDIVSESNINRQIIALHSTIGQDKVIIEKTRLLDINPNVKINTIKEFITPENLAYIDFSKFNFIIDAIDFTPAKIAIIEKAKAENIPIISSMGTGNKLHPEKFEIKDISKTSMCPLAKVIRKELGIKGIKNVPVLFSTEAPIKHNSIHGQKVVPSSISTVPSIAGLLMANYIILEIIKK